MKRKFTFLIAALFAIFLLTTPTKMLADSSFSTTYSYGETNWTRTGFTDEGTYYKSKSDEDGIATISGIFTDKTITSDVTITLNVACYGNGDNPTSDKFKVYTSSACSTQVTASQSGTLPSSSSYTNAVYTVTLANSSSFTNDLAIKVVKGTKLIRLKSIKVEFSYTNATPVDPFENIAALTATASAGSYEVTFDDVVVTYINGSYAYLQDASGAILYYKSGHSLTAGQVLNGTASVSYSFSNNNPRITSLSGINTTSGSAPVPTPVVASEWGYTFNNVLNQYIKITDASISYSNSKYYVSVGSTKTVESLQLYGLGDAYNFSIDNLSQNDVFTIIGFPTLYNSTKEFQIFAVPQRASINIDNSALQLLYQANTTGSIAVSYSNYTPTNVTAGLYSDAACQTSFTGGWMTLNSMTSPYNTIGYNISANTGNSSRTVYMKVEASNGKSTFNKIFTITQDYHHTYSVTYKANGGTGSDVVDAGYDYNAPVTVKPNDGTGNNPGFSRTGYNFALWNTQADGNGTPYDPEDNNIFNITANTNLYAQWEAKTYDLHTAAMTNGSVSFKVNNTTVTQADTDQTVAIVVSPADNYALSSLTVINDETGDEIEVSNTKTFTMPASSITVSATFVVNYNITYDFTDEDSFYIDSNLTTHPSTGNSNNYSTFYYKNGNIFTTTDGSTSTHNHYFSGDYYLIGKTDEMLNLPTFSNYKITQIIIHSSTGHSTSVNVGIVSGSNTVAATTNWGTQNQDYTYNIPVAYQSSALSIKVTNNYNTQFTSITLVRTPKSTNPEISASTDEINDFSYDEGYGPSTKSFTVSGDNLNTTAITVALETGDDFGLALTSNAENWSNSLTISPTAGAVNETTVYVRMLANLSEGSYSNNINVTWGNLSKSVALSGEVGPAPVENTYTLATSVTPGKRYIIVGFAGDNKTNPYALDEQKTNNRGAVNISSNYNSTDDEFTILSNAGVYEFAISGDATNKYSIYDTENKGYLYVTSGQNYLKQDATLTNSTGLWTIAEGDNDNMVISIKISSSETRIIRFNYSVNNQLFSCYTTGQKDVYLYEKESNDPLEFYSNTSLANQTLSASNTMTVESGATLTLTGSVSCDNASWLVVKDGGQLKVTSSSAKDGGVQATVQKNITGYGDGLDKWNFIASPVTPNILIANVTNLLGELISNDPEPEYNFDLYRLGGITEGNRQDWENYHKHYNDTDNPFVSLVNGQGYLYAKQANTTLSFAGTIKPYDDTYEISVSKGWNLVGNPYTFDAYASVPYYAMDEDGTGITANTVSVATAVKPCTGIVIYAENDGTIAFSDQGSETSVNHGNLQMVLSHNVASRGNNAETIDNAIVSFNEGTKLQKFYFGEPAANIFIPQNGEDYAIAFSNRQGDMPLNFKAKELGTYTISFEGEEMDLNGIYLIDMLDEVEIDLSTEPSYTFIGSPADRSARFKIVFKNNGNDSTSDIFAYQSGSDIVVSGEGELQIFDVMGRMVARHNVNGVQTINAMSHGVYIFKVNEKTQKIIVK